MQTTDAQQQVRRVLIITLILNLLVAAAKIGIGSLVGALSITADGFHSLADGASNIVALVGSAAANQPPDEQHPYGHQRFETIAAMGIGLLLFFTAWETLGGVVERLQGGEPPQVSAPVLIVLVITLLVNIGVNRYQIRESQRLNSQLLEADAANTGADVFVTLSVMAGMLLMLAFELYWIDIVAALAVTVLIAHAAWQIVQRTGSVLVDTAPFAPDVIRQAAEQVVDAKRIEQIRSRGSKQAAYIDMAVVTEPQTTAEETALTARLLENHLRDLFPGVQEVWVDFIPADSKQRETEDYRAVVMRLAASLGLSAHHIYMNNAEGGRVLEMHVEVESQQTLAEAHQSVSQLEAMVRVQLADIVDVITHIEPVTDMPDISAEQTARFRQMRGRVYHLLRAHFTEIDWHHLQLHSQPRGIGLTLHAGIPDVLSVAEAHDLAAAAERILREKISGLDRVTIHTEPLPERRSWPDSPE